MPISIAELWKLLVDSRLLSVQQCQQLNASFQAVKGAETQGNAKTLAHWLISQQLLTNYQATILLGGRSGPFFYGDYKIYERVTDDRLAGLFRAVHSPTGHPVLIEFLAGGVARDPNAWASAVNQALLHCQIRHPNLNQCHEPVDVVSYKFLVLEDLQGQSLQQLVTTSGQVVTADACRLLRLLAMGLSELHQHGLAHGDIRPWNFWLEPNGNAKLLRSPLTPPIAPNFSHPDASLLSRADYLAPEFAQPGKRPDFMTDIYALGCSFYQLLTGRTPFPGGDAPQKLGRHAAEPIQPLEPYGVPQPIAQLVSYMMAKNPSIRYQQVETVIEQLNNYVAPADMQPRPLPLPPTLASFEHWIKNKQAALSAQTESTAAPAPLANTPAARVAPKQAIPVGAIAAATAAKPARITIQAAPANLSRQDVSGAAEAHRQRHDRRRAKAVAIGLAATAGFMILGLILFSVFSHKPAEAVSGGDDALSQSQLDQNQAERGQSNKQSQDQAAAASTPTQAGGGGRTSSPGITVRDSSGNPAGSKPAAPVGSNPTPTHYGAPPTGNAAAVQVVEDPDGQLLWASPTAGSPISFRYVPPDSRVYLIIRPADLVKAPQGPMVLQALGPVFATALASWEQDSGVKPAEVKQLIMSLHDAGEQFPQPAFVVHLQQPIPKQELLARWKNPQPRQVESQTIYQGGAQAYYPASEDSVATFLMGPLANVKDVAQVGGVTPPLQREIGALRRLSDDQRHFTLIFQPQYLSSNLFRDGRRWYFGDPRKVRLPLDWLLGDDVKACSVSLDFGEYTYLEARVFGAIDVPHHVRAEQLRDRLREIPDQLRKYTATLASHPYWEMVRMQYPQMIRGLYRYSRVGVESDHALINCMLPDFAGHNLLFGSEMVLSAPSAGAQPVAADSPPSARTIQDVLAAKISISFEQDSLEFSMRNVVSEVKELFPEFDFRIVILGEDLKLDGITRNQQIRDFRQENKTVAEVLTALVMKANPVTTVQSPSEKDQKLLWVLGPDPANSEQVVLITTRQVAEQKYKLPADFQAP